MRTKLLALTGFLLLLAGLFPPKLSLYELTGEEKLPAQLLGVGHWLHSAVRPQPRLAPDAPLQHVDVPLLGVNTFLEQEVLPEVRAESLRLARAAGFSFIRQEFVWEDIEIAGRGDFVDARNDVDGDGIIDALDAWAKYDNIVALAEQHDLQIIARLSNPPAWSRAAGNEAGPHAPPDNFADYAAFVTAVVDRYRGRIAYVQLWNEPNIYPEWGEQDVDPEAYTALLCAGYEAAKAANPDIVVLAAALSPTINMSGRNMNDLVFLERMYRAGAGGCFDILSAQGYGLFSGPTDRRLRPVVINYPHNLLLRDVMVRHGDAAKPIWISEMAWNAVPDGLAQPFGQVTEAQQARYAVEAYERAAAEWPWVGVANYWFLKRAADFERDQPFYYFRLLEPDFTRLPAYDALQAAFGGENAPRRSAPGLPATLWQQARPALALGGGALLFLALLSLLAPPRRATS